MFSEDPRTWRKDYADELQIPASEPIPVLSGLYVSCGMTLRMTNGAAHWEYRQMPRRRRWFGRNVSMVKFVIFTSVSTTENT